MRHYRISITVPQAKVGTLTSLLLSEGTDFHVEEVNAPSTNVRKTIVRATKEKTGGKDATQVVRDYFTAKGSNNEVIIKHEIAAELEKAGFNGSTHSSVCADLVKEGFIRRTGMGRCILAA
jgi:hypothetical protein